VGQQLVLRLNPADKKKMEKGSDWEAIQKAGRRISLVADETLKPGDCIVESELGTVDARLENQWKAIRKAMGVED
jgi:type III secretion protein L